jgi:hypothetical protein
MNEEQFMEDGDRAVANPTTADQASVAGNA